MMLARCLLLTLIFLLSAAAHASDAAQTIVHMLDYVSVDYPEFVKDGKVLDQAEYKEQQEFAGQVIALFGKLAAGPRREQLVTNANALKSAIDAKAPGAGVSRLATDLRWQVIDAYKLVVAPKRAPDMKRGAALFAAQCAACHGATGRGDGPAGKGLEPAPSNFHDAERMAQRSLYGLYSTISLGVAGTSMQGYPQLSEEERWALAFYVGTLRYGDTELARGAALHRSGTLGGEGATLRAIATMTDRVVAKRSGAEAASVFAWLKKNPSAADAGAESPIDYSRRVLADSAAAYRAGKRDEAQRLALNAYLEGFELAEASLDTLDRNLRQEVETQMIAYRDLMRRGAPAEEVTQLAARIDSLLEASAEKLGSEGLSPTTAAVSAFFILLREGLEALLVVAAIIALLVKAGRRDALPWIHAGWIGALVLGFATWIAASTVIELSGATRELTEGVTTLLAAAILLYVGVWLHGRSHARAWQAFIDKHLTGALERGTFSALAGVSFLAVYREAFETVLFYQALWQQAGEGAHGSILVGFACAVAVLAIVAWTILRYSVRLPIGLFFGISGALLSVLAIVFTGHGVKALQEAGVIAASPFGAFNLPALGIYATTQSLLAQALVLALVCGGYVWVRRAQTRSAARA
jgi:high-affinity iron transporter